MRHNANVQAVAASDWPLENGRTATRLQHFVMPSWEVVVASSGEVQVFIDEKLKQCVAALQKIAMLADTGSDAYKEFAEPYLRMGDKPSGWRIAEEMRQVANDVVGSLPLEEDLTIYKRAMESMASQFIHPKTTAMEMAKAQLGIR